MPPRTRRAAAPKVAVCCPVPRMTGGVFMDWGLHKVGDPRPCRVCSRPAHCRDCTGTPCHKTCAEAELGRDATYDARTHEPIGASS